MERARRSMSSAVLGWELSVGSCKTQGGRRELQRKAPQGASERRREKAAVDICHLRLQFCHSRRLFLPFTAASPTLRMWKRGLRNVEGRTEGLSAEPSRHTVLCELEAGPG